MYVKGCNLGGRPQGVPVEVGVYRPCSLGWESEVCQCDHVLNLGSCTFVYLDSLLCEVY